MALKLSEEVTEPFTHAVEGRNTLNPLVLTEVPAPTQNNKHFDAAKHLAYKPPTKKLFMSDLGYDSTAISNVASTEPFPLLSYEAILAHRKEIFSKNVLTNCMHHTRPGSVQIRGIAPRYAPFIHEFWHSPEVLNIVSQNAGVDLVPAMDYEISHTNVQLDEHGLEGAKSTGVEPPIATSEAIERFNREKSKSRAVTDQTRPIVEWHKDSHPFVCVVMLSDAQYMVGGETELRKADGTTVKVKAPQMGYAALLQGRYITHTAAPVDNMPERVTIVTSFRPRNPTLLDETTNKNVRNESHLTELYYQWTTYRLDVLAQRAQIAVETLKQKYEDNLEKTNEQGRPGMCLLDTVDVQEVEKWAHEQIQYIQQTLFEMRPLDRFEQSQFSRSATGSGYSIVSH